MKTLNQILNFRLLALLFAAILITSCDSDDDAAPPEEDEVEVITNVSLIFTNANDPSDIAVALAVDPDGDGAMPLEVVSDIELTADTEYELTYNILNALDPTDVEDIGEEILEEDDEHQFFYSFTEGVFANPMGNGNIDNAGDPLNYEDTDGENPVGLITSWTTGGQTISVASFTARLQHQPDLKSATTGANDGDTDFDLTFDLTIVE